MKRLAVLLATALALLPGACSASGIAQAARVVSVTDGDTIVVELDGKRENVRLLGVDTPETGARGGAPEYFAQEATAFTASLVSGAEVRLEGDPANTDRDAYDRLLRYVWLPDGRMLNALILSEGYGHAYTRFPFARLDEFRRLEREARAGGVGLWSPDVIPRIPPIDARNHMGETVTTCGLVASARYLADADGQPTFLNIGEPHPNQALTVVIWGADREAFGNPESTYRDRDVCVTGKLRMFRGKPEIHIRDRSQILLED